jgi:hypothetical protein
VHCKRLDSLLRAQYYIVLSVPRAESRDLPQSGEKYWGATAALLNAIAEERGWPHYSHRDYAEIVEKLSEQLKEPLGPLFANAERLHANYHHSFLSPLNFKAHREQTLKLVEKLKALLTQGNGPESCSGSEGRGGS